MSPTLQTGVYPGYPPFGGYWRNSCGFWRKVGQKGNGGDFWKNADSGKLSNRIGGIDLGINTLTAQGRSDLLEVIEQRRGRKATLITSQLPVDKWHDYLSGGNPTVADAIMDRLVSGSHRIELKGDSMRKPRVAAKDKSMA